ncbi:bifunctional arginine demethylase and lysyl-hydroxylase JMJD6-B [Macrosteles quadrilineatus]|uniref:bifunctional arginine demethylase and lysyl-hydroxylase JMJD6-B n=1 Tax=Macrosteles quadrilineatus TaxID=74068 RepID=UPI0023E1C482|nr:bifunctional arginine demethylase and lysyl-hydroxylase JMJD6-B [Macrosteles quadrilineatus]
MEEAATRLASVLAHAVTLGVDLPTLPSVRLLEARVRPPHRFHAFLYFLAGVATVTLAVAYSLQLHTHAGLARAILRWKGYDIHNEKCAMSIPDRMASWLRPTEDCSICKGLSQVDSVADISPEEFEERYAYSGRPVVIRDGTNAWPGRQVMSFKFFQKLYNGSIDQIACQFFPYESGFNSLREVLSMDEARAQLKDGTKPWYIGWSNCDNQVAHILKEQYSRPYFLPETSENKKVDWIFMGSPGYGAKMHVDSVSHPSWQAQLRGRKKWTLQPPPECIYHCNTLEVVVSPGEIIVLDTNRWYHQTMILPGEMSITIGAEYD